MADQELRNRPPHVARAIQTAMGHAQAGQAAQPVVQAKPTMALHVAQATTLYPPTQGVRAAHVTEAIQASMSPANSRVVRQHGAARAANTAQRKVQSTSAPTPPPVGSPLAEGRAKDRALGPEADRLRRHSVANPVRAKAKIAAASMGSSTAVQPMENFALGGWTIHGGDRDSYQWVDAKGHSLPISSDTDLYRASKKGIVQGWKLHISVAPQDFNALLKIAVPILLKDFKGMEFKTAPDQAAYNGFIGTNAGKAITIYPRNNAELQQVVTSLEPLLLHLSSGPPVKGELALGTQRKFYTRYGGFFGKIAEKQKIVNLRERKMEEDPRGKNYRPQWTEEPQEIFDLALEQRINARRLERLQNSMARSWLFDS